MSSRLLFTLILSMLLYSTAEAKIIVKNLIGKKLAAYSTDEKGHLVVKFCTDWDLVNIEIDSCENSQSASLEVSPSKLIENLVLGYSGYNMEYFEEVIESRRSEWVKYANERKHGDTRGLESKHEDSFKELSAATSKLNEIVDQLKESREKYDSKYNGFERMLHKAIGNEDLAKVQELESKRSVLNTEYNLVRSEYQRIYRNGPYLQYQTMTNQLRLMKSLESSLDDNSSSRVLILTTQPNNIDSKLLELSGPNAIIISIRVGLNQIQPERVNRNHCKVSVSDALSLDCVSLMLGSPVELQKHIPKYPELVLRKKASSKNVTCEIIGSRVFCEKRNDIEALSTSEEIIKLEVPKNKNEFYKPQHVLVADRSACVVSWGGATCWTWDLEGKVSDDFVILGSEPVVPSEKNNGKSGDTSISYLTIEEENLNNDEYKAQFQWLHKGMSASGRINSHIFPIE